MKSTSTTSLPPLALKPVVECQNPIEEESPAPKYYRNSAFKTKEAKINFLKLNLLQCREYTQQAQTSQSHAVSPRARSQNLKPEMNKPIIHKMKKKH